jgi:hypothetical protein
LYPEWSKAEFRIQSVELSRSPVAMGIQSSDFVLSNASIFP